MRFLNRHPGRSGQWLLTLLPFLILALLYAFGSATRLADNPNDKLLPSLAQMVDAVRHMAFMEDPRTGDYLFWSDTLASLQRVLLGLGIAAVAGLVMGIANGIFPVLRAGFSPLLTVISMVPPLAILPILFIVMGLDELSKVMLIVIGVTPLLGRSCPSSRRRKVDLPQPEAPTRVQNWPSSTRRLRRSRTTFWPYCCHTLRISM